MSPASHKPTSMLNYIVRHEYQTCAVSVPGEYSSQPTPDQGTMQERNLFLQHSDLISMTVGFALDARQIWHYSAVVEKG